MKTSQKPKELLKYNIPFAITVLVIVVILSSVLGINRSLNSLSKKVVNAYMTNDDTYGCAYTDVLDFISCAEAMTDALEKVSEETGDAYKKALKELKDNKESPFGLYDRLYAVLSIVEQNDSNFTQEYSYLRGMHADLKTLHNNETYIQAATNFNQSANSITAKLYFGSKNAAVF